MTYFINYQVAGPFVNLPKSDDRIRSARAAAKHLQAIIKYTLTVIGWYS